MILNWLFENLLVCTRRNCGGSLTCNDLLWMSYLFFMHSFDRFSDLNSYLRKTFGNHKHTINRSEKKYIANVNARNKNSFVGITCQVCCYVSHYK